MAERAVQTVKSVLRKAMEAKAHYLDLIMEYHLTPLSGVGLSPAEIVFGRKLRSCIPNQVDQLQNKYSSFVHEKLIKAQGKMAKYYNQHAKARKDFGEEDKVLIQRADKTWEPAKVVRKCDQPRSYIVSDSTGNCKRRNQFHLRQLDHSSDTDEEADSNSDPLLNHNAPQMNQGPPSREVPSMTLRSGKQKLQLNYKKRNYTRSGIN